MPVYLYFLSRIDHTEPLVVERHEMLPSPRLKTRRSFLNKKSDCATSKCPFLHFRTAKQQF
jgi:hypothetical protein